jgi:hypothetical protein
LALLPDVINYFPSAASAGCVLLLIENIKNENKKVFANIVDMIFSPVSIAKVLRVERKSMRVQ